VNVRSMLRARAKALCGFIILLVCALILYVPVIVVIVIVIITMVTSSFAAEPVATRVNEVASSVTSWYLETMAKATIRRSFKRGSMG